MIFRPKYDFELKIVLKLIFAPKYSAYIVYLCITY